MAPRQGVHAVTPVGPDGAPPGRLRLSPYMLAAAAVALALAGVRLGDEHYVSLQGDMPRHLMNGVFFLDAARDLPAPADWFEYARHYYARYPALSLGHHPFLIALAEAPVFALLGVSVTSGRLVSLAFFLIGVVYAYRLASELFADERAGAAAGIAMASSAFLVELAQSVMTELPAVSLVTAAAYYCHRFARDGKARAIVLATLLAAGAAWAKQISVVVLPALVLFVWWQIGVRRLLRRDVLIAVAVAGAIVAPLVPITLYLSPFNVALASGLAQSVTETGRIAEAGRALTLAANAHFAAPVLVAVAAGLALATARRPVVGAPAGLWILATGVFVVLTGASVAPVRYAIYWIPGAALAVGALVSPLAGRARTVTSVVVAIALAAQVAASSRVRLPGLDGYEQAARHVVAEPRGSTVLFAGDVDTGFFTFFVRKHDPARRTIVLRADKILTTSFMGAVAAEDRVSSAAEIREVLTRFGVGYVVVEDRPSESIVHNWLLAEVRTSGFAERLRLPANSTDPRLRDGKTLVVYEVVGASAATADARLDIRLPLVAQQIDVAVSDLVQRKYLR
jgi:Dolichyl-phosphate-mannose-protein mannosyltransferase